MAKFKIVYTDNIYKDNDIEYRRFDNPDYEFVIANVHEEADLIKACKDADAIMVSFAEMTETVINSLEKCKFIIRCGMGVNNVDIAAATKKGIMVSNVQKYCIDEVSDHALALMLTLIRKTALFKMLTKEGVWDPAKARPIPRISELTLGLYGLGAISSAVANKAKAFGMTVNAYDPFLPAERFKEMGVGHIEDEAELFKTSDVLSVHVPLLPATTGIISYDKLKLMKPSAIIINTARGALIQEDGLIKALSEGVIGGAGLDVLTAEYPEMNNPLFQMDNVVVTPHIAYYSEGSDIDLRNYSCDQVIQALNDEIPTFILNRKELGI